MKYPEQESSLLEFKKEIPKNEQIIKTIVAFCNHKGGKLIVGIDNDGTISGIHEDQVQQVLEYVEKSIYEATHPTIIPLVYTQKIGDKTLLIIEVFPGSNKPYFIKSEGAAKGVYIRLGRSTLRASTEIIQELSFTARGRSLDQMPVYHASIEDLDEKKVRDFLANKKVPITSNITLETVLCDYLFAVREHTKLYPTTAGILLFGKNPQYFFPQAYIVCTHFAHTTLTHTDVLVSKDFTGTIMEQFYEAYDFVGRRLSHFYVVKGPRRIDTLELPIAALREVMINAIAHRNYLLSSPIKIAIFADRIEVYSPGDFPGPLTQKNLLQGLSFIRNNTVCKVLKEVGIIEAFGIGFTTLFQQYATMHLTTPDVIEGENFVKCVLPRSHTKTRTAGQGNSDETERIIKLFQTATAITIKDIIENLHLTRTTAGRRLKELVTKKIISKVGDGRLSHYIKNDSVDK